MRLTCDQPIGSDPNAQVFFQGYLAGPLVIALYLFWKLWSRGRGGMYVKAHEMDLMTGMRSFDVDSLDNARPKKTLANLPKRVVRGLF